MKAILFDLDDTLHDKSGTLRLVAEHQYTSFSLSGHGIDLSDWIDAYVEKHNQRVPKQQVFEKLIDQFQLDSSSITAFFEAYDRVYGEMALSFTGAIELLRACKQHEIKVACVTNGRDCHQRSKIEGMGMNMWFESIVTSGAVGLKKPNLSIFNQCLDELKVRAKDCVLVGDNYQADIVPALQLGMRAIWKSPCESTEVELCTDSLDEIRLHLFGCS